MAAADTGAPPRFGEGFVAEYTPVSFAMAFVTKLRKNKRIANVPSLRTTVAIPAFLSARAMRLGTLTPRDFLEAAVYNTAPEDQAIAEIVAREILFPKTKDAAVEVTTPTKAEKSDEVAAVAPQASDPMAGILGDLAALDVDLDSLTDLASLDDLLNQREETAQGSFGAFDLFEQLVSSTKHAERSLGELMTHFGGPMELEAMGATDEDSIRGLLADLLRGQIGNLSPAQVYHGCKAGFGDLLAKETRSPWELAAALSGSGDSGLAAHLSDLLRNGTAHELGRVMQFLVPHVAELGGELAGFREQGLGRARDLAEFAEVLRGLGEWIEPSSKLVESSLSESVLRTMNAARNLEATFQQPVPVMVFEQWAKGLSDVPPLDFLLDVVAPSRLWDDLAQKAYERYVEELHDAKGPRSVEERTRDAFAMAKRLDCCRNSLAAKLARALATETLTLVKSREKFLGLLDAFLEEGIIPSDQKRLVRAGHAARVSEDEILARLEQPLEQLKYLIQNQLAELGRYLALALHVTAIPGETMETLVSACLEGQNRMGMAALLAVDLGLAAKFAPAPFVLDSIAYKGIGGGENLLKQWYCHRDELQDPLRERIKEITRNALVDLAFDTLARSAGSTEQGLIPQNQARPFRASDDLDLLDIESTLDAIVSSGKPIDQVSLDDLFVYDTTRGRAAFGVLLDISGSMSGKELAICALAAMMLLGRLEPEELAIALFESNTHVIKGFAEHRDLDTIADQLLDLRATGGTCVDQALRWIGDEFAGAPEHETRLLFLLSDFCFFEELDALRPLGERLAELGVRLLGAAHGAYNEETCALLRATMGGSVVRLPSLAKLPRILEEALRELADGC